jgi:hypothetical protein
MRPVLTEAAAEKEIQSRGARLSPLYSTTTDAWLNIYVYERGEQRAKRGLHASHFAIALEGCVEVKANCYSFQHLKLKLCDLIILSFWNRSVDFARL